MKKIILAAVFMFTAGGVIYSESVSDSIISKARTLVGSPYRMGGISPSGFDCSGFISYLYKTHVPGIPRVSRDQAKTGDPVSRNRLLPGDLVFFATGKTPGRVTHVALYIGQNSIIHSISNGPERGVVISSLNARYWKNRYHNSTRILNNIEEKRLETAENMIFAKGIYNGALKHGEPSGKGSMLLKNGDRYEGEFRAGLFHGRGTYIWADGRVFTGLFASGSFRGRGIVITADGTKMSGVWKDDEFIPDSLASADTVSRKPDSAAPDTGADSTEEAGGREAKSSTYDTEVRNTEAASSDLLSERSKNRAAPGIRAESYIVAEDSPWDTFDGIVDGDFDLWFKKDMDAFEEWKKNN